MVHGVITILLKVFIPAVALLFVSQYVPGIIVSNMYTAVIVALLLGVVHMTLKPILFLITLPVTLLTFGLFSFVLNALLFWFVATFVDGFYVAGFLPALIGATLISLASTLGSKLSD